MADEPKEPTAADRIRAAIADKPARGYAKVNAEDVIAVAGAVPPANQTRVTAALAKGALNAPRRANDDGDPVPSPIFVEAGKLAQLLEAAGAVAQ